MLVHHHNNPECSSPYTYFTYQVTFFALKYYYSVWSKLYSLKYDVPFFFNSMQSYESYSYNLKLFYVESGPSAFDITVTSFTYIVLTMAVLSMYSVLRSLEQPMSESKVILGTPRKEDP